MKNANVVPIAIAMIEMMPTRNAERSRKFFTLMFFCPPRRPRARGLAQRQIAGGKSASDTARDRRADRSSTTLHVVRDRLPRERPGLGTEVDHVEVPPLAVSLGPRRREQNLFQVLGNAVEGAELVVDDVEQRLQVCELLVEVRPVAADDPAELLGCGVQLIDDPL